MAVYLCRGEKEEFAFHFALLESHACFWVKQEGLIWFCILVGDSFFVCLGFCVCGGVF